MKADNEWWPLRVDDETARELCRKARAGDTNARRDLVTGFLWLAAHVADYWSWRGKFEYDELFQEAATNLMHTVTCFNPERRQATMETYLYAILVRHLREVAMRPNVCARLPRRDTCGASANDFLSKAVKAVDVHRHEPKSKESDQRWELVSRDRRRVEAALERIDPRWAAILRRRMSGETFEQISRDLRVQKQRVHQIQVQAIEAVQGMLVE